MSKLFTPFSVIIGLLAGQMAKKVFIAVWGQAANEESPSPEHREVAYGQLVVALAVEGAIQRLVRGFADHGLRHAWMRSMGEWPGEERPDPK